MKSVVSQLKATSNATKKFVANSDLVQSAAVDQKALKSGLYFQGLP